MRLMKQLNQKESKEQVTQEISRQNLEKQELVARKAGPAELMAKETQNKAERQQGNMKLFFKYFYSIH